MLDRRVRRAIPLAIVLAVVVVGLWLVSGAHWRRGAALFAAAAVLSAIMRLTVPTRWIGMLAVRSRVFDALFLLALAALFIAAVAHP